MFLLLAVNATGLVDMIFTADSALYACISRSFALSGNFSDIMVEGNDWLDKPHFPFWVCALSMKLFGITTFAYKLPSLLFFIMGLFYTYRLAKEFYPAKTARVATLLLASSLHIILSNNDTRAEAILLGLVAAGSFHLYRLAQKYTMTHLLAASAFCAAAVMTKGIFVMIIFYGALGGPMLLQGRWRELFGMGRLYAHFLLTMLLTFPELYSVYRQFDMHPEKTVFGTTGVSGIRFFLWDSQFGRFFNTGPIKGKGDPLFFIHTFLWSFGPWSVAGIAALASTIRHILKKQATETFAFFGFIPMFLIFSLSKFQLPHYINILYPFMAIMAAQCMASMEKENLVFRISRYSIFFFCLVFIVLIAVTGYLFRPEHYDVLAPLSIGLIIIMPFLFHRLLTDIKEKIIATGIASVAIIALFMNLCFYPSLLPYQSGSQAAAHINKNEPSAKVIPIARDWTLEYYLDRPLTWKTEEEAIMQNSDENTLIFAGEDFIEKMQARNIPYDVVQEFEHFHTTKITRDFFYHRTRNKAIKKRYLIRIASSGKTHDC